jgi:hypothetical protein
MIFGLGIMAGWMMKPEDDPNDEEKKVAIMVILQAKHDLLKQLSEEQKNSDYSIPNFWN